MICKQCGAELSDGSLFCPNCGVPQAAHGQPENTATAEVAALPKKKTGLILGICLGVVALIAVSLAIFFLQPEPNVFSQVQLDSIKAIAQDRMEGVAELLDTPVTIDVTVEDLGLDGLILGCEKCSEHARNYAINFDIKGDGLSNVQMAALVFFMEYMYGSSYTSEGFDYNLDSPHDLSTFYDIHQENPAYKIIDTSSSLMGVNNLPTDFSWTANSSFTVNGNWLGYIASDSPRSSSVIVGLEETISASEIVTAFSPD